MSDWRRLTTMSDRVTLRAPVTDMDLQDLRSCAGLQLPQEYEDFLRCSDGLDVYSSIVFPSKDAVVRNTRPITENWDELYMPVTGLFFFGEDASGDLFFFRRLKSCVDQSVYVWRHEDDSRIQIAFSLAGFLEKYLSGDYDAWNL
ncbi:hypothetical protein DEIGR_100978 [Deinococcus grandis]|uniref:Knr4/Smi1-like domain-containing protein n=2 Tax=Deinococcus grandis TaxID=57498 RepID=A0A100HHP9_9DEIO|nr:hypothetical protein DEGR_22940 [Deinococcus grandis]GAQ20951.1 hypothetical protein DEIGR_100978 [Deinococcus grandis]